MAYFDTNFDYRDRVIIDGDRSLIGVVTAFCFRETRGLTIEVSYIHNGAPQAPWIEEWRLEQYVEPAMRLPAGGKPEKDEIPF